MPLLRCAAAAGLLVLTSSLPAQPAAAPVGYEYTVRSSEPGDDGDSLRVRVAGRVARIDGRSTRGNGRPGDYLLVHDGGQRVVIVRPAERTYSELSGEEFESMLGRLLSKADKVVTIKLRNASVRSARLGAGAPLLGLSTERGQLTQEFTVGVGALGFTKDVRQRVQIECWVSRELPMPENPAVMLLASTQSVLAQHDIDFVRRSRVERRKVCPGMPLKLTITTWSEEDGQFTRDDGVRTIEVVEARKAAVDPKALDVPAGFRRDDTKFGWSISM